MSRPGALLRPFEPRQKIGLTEVDSRVTAIGSQLFSFERDGRHFAVGVNAPPSDAERADELAATVMTSLR